MRPDCKVPKAVNIIEKECDEQMGSWYAENRAKANNVSRVKLGPGQMPPCPRGSASSSDVRSPVVAIFFVDFTFYTVKPNLTNLEILANPQLFLRVSRLRK